MPPTLQSGYATTLRVRTATLNTAQPMLVLLGVSFLEDMKISVDIFSEVW